MKEASFTRLGLCRAQTGSRYVCARRVCPRLWQQSRGQRWSNWFVAVAKIIEQFRSLMIGLFNALLCTHTHTHTKRVWSAESRLCPQTMECWADRINLSQEKCEFPAPSCTHLCAETLHVCFNACVMRWLARHAPSAGKFTLSHSPGCEKLSSPGYESGEMYKFIFSLEFVVTAGGQKRT